MFFHKPRNFEQYSLAASKLPEENPYIRSADSRDSFQGGGPIFKINNYPIRNSGGPTEEMGGSPPPLVYIILQQKPYTI